MIAVKYQLIFRPRHMLPNRSQIRTIDQRYTSVKIGLKLTSIQMTPYPLRSMTIHRKKFTTLRIWPAYTFIMHYLNIYPFPLNVKFHLTHFPRPKCDDNTSLTSINFVPFGAILPHLLTH
jgi:hypothetical protein